MAVDAVDPTLKVFLASLSGARDRIQKIVFFGSRVRGDEKPYSDYDVLLVVAERERDLMDAVHDAVMDALLVNDRGQPDVWVYNLPNEPPTRRTFEGGILGEKPVQGNENQPYPNGIMDRKSGFQFSPDGRWVAYVSAESGRPEVFVAPYPGPGAK